jgi:hypothetical protein
MGIISMFVFPYHCCQDISHQYVCHSLSILVSYCQNALAFLYVSVWQFQSSWQLLCAGHQINLVSGKNCTCKMYDHPSETVHFRLCHCHHLCYIAPVLSQVYADVLSVGSHVPELINLYTKVLMFPRNVSLGNKSPVTSHRAKYLAGLWN